jgi:hypothetical protein
MAVSHSLHVAIAMGGGWTVDNMSSGPSPPAPKRPFFPPQYRGWWIAGMLIVFALSEFGRYRMGEPRRPDGLSNPCYWVGVLIAVATFGTVLGSILKGLWWLVSRPFATRPCPRCGSRRVGDFCARCGAKLATNK